MRTAFLVILAAALGGCGVELLATTAIQSELQAQNVQAINRQVSHAADSSARINIQQAIDTFHAENGRLPASLDELVPRYLINGVPVKPDGSSYGYDAATGKVLDSPAPSVVVPRGPTANDSQKQRQIQNAINQYGMNVGYYPPSLSALVPAYLQSVPKTDSGEDFYYNCADGTLAHPAQRNSLTAAPNRPAGVGVGGAGPMGEVMTGIGMQNQLNSMSNAGASSAGTRMRGSVGGTAGTHNQQQEQVMNNLGL